MSAPGLLGGRLKKARRNVAHMATSVASTIRKPHQYKHALKGMAIDSVKGVPKMVKTYKKTGALTFPGSNYIGPGNQLDMGKPTSKADRLAYVHDHHYSELEKKGVNPYFTFNEADRQMLKNNDATTKHGMAVALGINAKRIFKNDYTPVSKVDPWEKKYGGERS